MKAIQTLILLLAISVGYLSARKEPPIIDFVGNIPPIESQQVFVQNTDTITIQRFVTDTVYIRVQESPLYKLPSSTIPLCVTSPKATVNVEPVNVF